MIRIDDLAEADLEAALAVDLESFHGDPAVRATQLREELARPWARIRASRGDEGLNGYCLFWLVADEAHLINVAVASSARRRGLGRALLLDLIAIARGHGATKVLLEVRAGNAAAISLYETQGFERLRVRKGYYDDGEDGVEMMLTIG